MQLRPHFLFNALNTISAYMEKDAKTARRMAAHLGDLLRFSLEKSDTQEITLAEELALLEHYLEIQRARFEERLQVKMSIDPQALEALVPSLLLQPLVENSIRHGIAPRASGGTIEVHARQENGKLHLQVCDNGVGLQEGWQHRVGLSNTNAMLAQLYNGEHELEIRNRPEGGVAVEIVLPFHRGERAKSELRPPTP
jgi:LytS/YehU family sensor histidine kinase